MNILVTGGAGFIGSNLVDKFIELNHNVTVIDNESSECHENFYWNNKSNNYKYDICDYDLISPLFKNIDIVFHIAAEARIQPSLINPLKTLNTNVIGTCNVLQASKINGIKRFIYSSTSSAYGKNNLIPFKEDMNNDCLTPYSIAKVCGEDLCKMYFKLFNLNTVILRYFNVYGERQPTKGQYAPVIGLFEKQKKENRKLTIVGDGLQKRDFTHISDVVNANLYAAFNNNSKIFGELFNVGTGKNYSIIDIAKLFDHEFEFIPPRIGEARNTLADITKMKTYMNWESKFNLEDWINAKK